MKPLLAALVLAAACSSGEAELPVQPAGAPVARLLLPRFAAPGDPVQLDGSRSFSPGGALVHFRFLPGDGTAVVDLGAAQASHGYAAEGVYSVSLAVEDLQGRTARADGQLTVRAQPPSCRADADCGGFDTCVRGSCLALWGPPCASAADAGACRGCATDSDCPAASACRAGVCGTP